MLLQATAVGGAVALNSILMLNMSDNTFIGNTAGQGGALLVQGTTTSALGIQSGRCDARRRYICIHAIVSLGGYTTPSILVTGSSTTPPPSMAEAVSMCTPSRR